MHEILSDLWFCSNFLVLFLEIAWLLKLIFMLVNLVILFYQRFLTLHQNWIILSTVLLVKSCFHRAAISAFITISCHGTRVLLIRWKTSSLHFICTASHVKQVLLELLSYCSLWIITQFTNFTFHQGVQSLSPSFIIHMKRVAYVDVLDRSKRVFTNYSLSFVKPMHLKVVLRLFETS